MTLFPSASAGSVFTGWSGACTNATGDCVVTMTEAKSVTANFAIARTLTVTKTGGNGTGTVTSSPSGINCGATCAAPFADGSSVTLTAAPTSTTSTFAGWSGPCTPRANTCTATMSEARTVNAVFNLAQRTLTAQVNGSGTMQGGSGGIDCPSDCTHDYDHGTQVTLSATPQTGWAFSSWGGACTGTNVASNCTLTMDQARNTIANFTITQRALNVDVTGSGEITSAPTGIDCPGDCTQNYDYNTQVTLTPEAATGWVFNSWGGACSGTLATSNCVVTMTDARNATATFTITQRTLTVNTNGSGSVTSSPVGVDCPTDCTNDYDYGSEITLTPEPDTGWVFSSWGGACTGTNVASNCTLTMDQARNTIANFTITQRTLTVDVTGSGSVASEPNGVDCPGDCTQDYDYDTQVTLTPEAETGWVFSSWGGACSGTEATSNCVVTMTEARNATATFTITKRTLTVNTSRIGHRDEFARRSRLSHRLHRRLRLRLRSNSDA